EAALSSFATALSAFAMALSWAASLIAGLRIAGLSNAAAWIGWDWTKGRENVGGEGWGETIFAEAAADFVAGPACAFDRTATLLLPSCSSASSKASSGARLAMRISSNLTDNCNVVSSGH